MREQTALFGCRFRMFLLAFIAMTLPLVAAAQTTTRIITGLVIDENKEPLIGASVVVPGTSMGTITDFDGNFTLQLPVETKTVEVSYIGCVKQVITLTKDNAPIKVVLKTDAQLIDEVVVIGYGTQKKEDLTGSVSTVGEKDFNSGVVSSPEELINGKIAGVQIINSGGSPNASATIRVRGGASLNASNDPLIVLDGVPMEVGGGVTGSGNFLSLINPNDIESMTILKDASSTAIYGSRASNGVIIINTKKGGGDKIKISLQSTNSVANRTKTADMLSLNQFKNAYQTQGTADQIALIGNERTNWNDAIYQTALGTDNSLSIAGRATSWLPFRVALGYMNQDGILRTDNSTRYTGNINLTPSFFDDHLHIRISGKGTYSKNRFAETGAIWNALVYNPTVPVRDANSIFGGYTNVVDNVGKPAQGAQANPVGQLNLYNSTSKVYRFVGNVDMDYRFPFAEGLRLHTTAGYDYSKGTGEVYVPESNYSYYSTGGRDYSYGPQKNFNKLLTVYANYKKDIDALNSNVDLTLGYDYQYWKSYNSAYDEYNVAGDVQASSAASDQRHTLLSYYGRLNYTLADKYMLTGTFRRDGSSRFSKDNRWGTFPSVALAWRVSKESFYEPISSVMNDFKLRVSYGITGQQDGISNYGYLPIYTISQQGAQYQLNGTPIHTYRPEAYNPDLTWETTKSWNAGFDFGFLNNRITGSVDYYNRKTEDLLASVPTPAGVNFDKMLLTNVGNVDSQGIEMSLNAHVINTDDWSWSVTANATWQRSRITNMTLIPGADSPDTEVGPYIDSYQMQVFSTGHAPYSYYLYKQIYDKETGRPIEGLYADLNGDGEITADDRYHTHSPSPDWIFGLSTSLQYKKWTLSTSLRAQVGNYVYNGMEANMGAWECTTWCSGQLNNLSSSYLKTGFQKRQYLSDYYLENAAFLKMDNLQLSYDFGRIANSFDLHVSTMVQNVFTITKYGGIDPESQTGVDTSVYPRPRTYSLTVGLNF